MFLGNSGSGCQTVKNGGDTIKLAVDQSCKYCSDSSFKAPNKQNIAAKEGL